ncbi:dihydrolipoyl dehydrogenase [Paenibacillus profundus]|uniref:Dihydrolipoyl dehydrogenase n=1 Tax=Paenibacillus profundus TaxID=1173085 RepID=A0ABS8YSI8_9BACL|nr:dihydrolipoyl dehydrogenase [Paenibacillus profundus]MCE5173590.1 dihydrolipoyl dehydrogenase [Paenibacillus profundus]
MTKQVDVAILGGGTGGYIAAIAASQAGKKVVVIEREKLGGTCLHRGCIPSKALLRSAELYRQAQNSSTFGIEIEGVKLNFERVQSRKQEVVEQLHRGVQFLMRKHHIEVIQGNGRVMGPSIFSPKSGSVAVECDNGEAVTLVPKQLIIATGSRPRALPGLQVDGTYVVTTDEALEWTALPRRVAIVGGGVIGMEWASMLVDFGVEVDVIEAASHIVPQEDEDTSRELERQLKKRGARIHTQAKIQTEEIHVDEAAGEVHLLVEVGGETSSIIADKLLVCIGRQANIENIGLENSGVESADGFIRVNEWMQTNEPHIYAIGDVIGGLQLAHAASAEALAAVSHFNGQAAISLDYRRIPRCIYSMPEAASIGWTEKEARAAGMDIQVSKMPFQAIGKAIVHGETDGFVKVIADAKSSDLLGVHIVGPHATELIGEAAVAKWLDATPWEMGHVIHPHPSLSEIMGEAMLAMEGRSLSM